MKNNTIVVLQCKKCNSFIWSRNRHDMRWCRCGKCAIDGGRDYVKISGNPGDFETHVIKVPKNVAETSFVKFGKDCMKINVKNQFEIANWADPKGVAVKLALLTSEVSEALEDVRNGDIYNFVEEIADVFVRTFDVGVAIAPNNFENAFKYIARELYIKIQINLLRGIKHSGGVKGREKKF